MLVTPELSFTDRTDLLAFKNTILTQALDPETHPPSIEADGDLIHALALYTFPADEDNS